MKNIILSVFVLLGVFFINSCHKDNDDDDTVIIGEVAIDLDANKSFIRAEEAPIGNMIADAFKEYAENEGLTPDFALMNSGSIRFSEDTRPNGIYPAGTYTSKTIAEIFPWSDERLTLVKISGSELKNVFERSVSSLPSEYKGWFMQVSKELKIQIDLSKKAQVINETVDPIVIETPGERITSIKINNVEVNDTVIYNALITRFLAAGEDGYVTFANIPSEDRIVLNCGGCEMNERALSEYIKNYSPVTPVIEGRITFVNN